MSRLLVVLVASSLASTASADVWRRALDENSIATRDRYEIALAKGDELALRANARSQPKDKATQLVDQAIDAYEEAGALRKDLGEPYFRIAAVLQSFFIDCDDAHQTSQYLMTLPPMTCPPLGAPVDPARMQQTIDAWDAFEKRAHLDPRLSEVLFSRAILRTKLVDGGKASQKHLEGALKDYLAILDRADGMTHVDLDGVWGNLAETYMMLGKLEPAIDAYRTALRLGADSSTAFGLAVALDRDENFSAAAEVIRAQSREAVRNFRDRYNKKSVFFVPAGEEYYYFALMYQVFGEGYEHGAISFWKLFLASGAHPQYQARARHHLAELEAKVRTQPQPPSRRRIDVDLYDLYP